MRFILNLVLMLLLHPGIPFTGIAAYEESPSKETATQQNSEPGIIEKSADTLENHTLRIAKNFLVLMENEWKEWTQCLKSILFWSFFSATGGFLIGGFLAYGIYWLLKRYRAFNLSCGWYRYVSWIWPLSFIFWIGLGCSYAGFWYGGGKCIRYWIQDQKILDNVVIRFYGALVLDNAQYEVTGNETNESYKRLANDSQFAWNFVDQEVVQRLDNLHRLTPTALSEKWWWPFLSKFLTAEMIKKISGTDPGTILMMLTNQTQLNTYLKENPDAGKIMHSINMGLDANRKNVCLWTDSTVHPQVFIGLATGFSIPLSATLIFWISVSIGRLASSSIQNSKS